MNILVNNEIVRFTQDDFPILITGACKKGASLFSVSLVTSLFESRNKILFLTAYPEAKADFRKQLGDSINERAIIIDSGEQDVFMEKLDEAKDLDETIILLKNMENYSTKLFNKLKDKKLVIFSGDIDECVFGEQLANKDFKTKIFFSYPKIIKIENKIDLPKYNGHIIGDKYNGIVKFEE
ncbi:MAG TPA: hypothetical protein VIK86_07685 [Candidatus Paceibacterota bacterium]